MALAPYCGVAVPDSVEPGLGPQVVDVPMRTLEALPVMRDPRAEPSRPECAANVKVESGLQSHQGQATDSDERISCAGENQHVCPRIRSQQVLSGRGPDHHNLLSTEQIGPWS